jgi:hypothetical protein
MQALESAIDVDSFWEYGDPAASTTDGYVFEEISENLALLRRADEARPCFGRAFDELAKDEWFVKNDAARLSSLRSRAGRSM